MTEVVSSRASSRLEASVVLSRRELDLVLSRAWCDLVTSLVWSRRKTRSVSRQAESMRGATERRRGGRENDLATHGGVLCPDGNRPVDDERLLHPAETCLGLRHKELEAVECAIMRRREFTSAFRYGISSLSEIISRLLDVASSFLPILSRVLEIFSHITGKHVAAAGWCVRLSEDLARRARKAFFDAGRETAAKFPDLSR